MMQCELVIDRQLITKITAINKGPIASVDEHDDWFVYEWNAWRIDPDNPRVVLRYAAGELVHRRGDEIEELALKILTQYRSILTGNVHESG